MEKTINDYIDIIDQERPKSNRPKMSLTERAAQFSPFAALTGFENVIENTSEFIEKQIEET